MSPAVVLVRPLPPLRAALGVAGLSAAVATYCVAYSRFSGGEETFASGLGWALVNVAPWLIALEILKRLRGAWPMAIIMILAGTVSIVAGSLLGAEISSFELWRRVPALIATVALVLLIWRTQARHDVASAPVGPIPIPAGKIDWIRAAGNYVELVVGGRTILHRTTLSAAERELGDKGFVRIHRSILVRRDRIERVRGADVVLCDGTHLKVGKRYRAALAA